MTLTRQFWYAGIPTQGLAFIPREIAAGVAVFPGPRYCAVLETSALSVSLLSDDALLALEQAYQAFLASLDCPLQILVRARPADVSPYVLHLRAAAARLGDPLLLRLALAHQGHVERLVAQKAPLERRFYVVVSVDDDQDARSGGGLLHRRRHTATTASFEDAARVLRARCIAVTSGLVGLGLQARRLDTQELAALWYDCLCPRTARVQPLTREPLIAIHAPIAARGGNHARVSA